MPEIESKDTSLKSLKGLHLWHAPMSSCSQRVRIALEEVGADYESHIVDLEAGEHGAPEYQVIHPDGLVPAFVSDGRLFIESIDIIREIGGDTLEAADPHRLLKLADDAQVDLKLLSFEFLKRADLSSAPDAAEAIQNTHPNTWLNIFRRDFAKGFTRDRLNAAIARTDAGFWTLEDVLSDGRDYFDGNAVSTLDIAWMPNLHRFALMDWPFHRYPRLSEWFERIKARDSFRDGLLAFQPDSVEAKFAAYTAQRKCEGTDITSFDPFQRP